MSVNDGGNKLTRITRDVYLLTLDCKKSAFSLRNTDYVVERLIQYHDENF